MKQIVKRLMPLFLGVLSITPILANYYSYVLGAGCSEYEVGLTASVGCSVEGGCYSPAETHNAAVYCYLACHAIAGWISAQGTGSSTSIMATGHGGRNDGLYSFDISVMCQCDAGCVEWDNGTNPFPC